MAGNEYPWSTPVLAARIKAAEHRLDMLEVNDLEYRRSMEKVREGQDALRADFHREIQAVADRFQAVVDGLSMKQQAQHEENQGALMGITQGLAALASAKARLEGGVSVLAVLAKNAPRIILAMGVAASALAAVLNGWVQKFVQRM